VAYPLKHATAHVLTTQIMSKSFGHEQTDETSKELFLYRLIATKGLKDTFPNVEVALRIYLVLMVSNCSSERSFSKLKFIKNRLRTTMQEDRLVGLTLLSIECDILRQLEFDDVIDDFATKKSRKVSVSM